MLNSCCLEDVKTQKTATLTENMKRRLTLAMALIGRPKVVILDDPFAGSDPVTTIKLKQTILQETEGSTLLICT